MHSKRLVWIQNIFRVHHAGRRWYILLWYILLWPIHLYHILKCHIRRCHICLWSILICKEIKGTLTMDSNISMVIVWYLAVNICVLYWNVFTYGTKQAQESLAAAMSINSFYNSTNCLTGNHTVTLPLLELMSAHKNTISTAHVYLCTSTLH